MRVVRVQYSGKTFYATLGPDHVLCLNKDINLNEPIPLDQVILLPPVAPSKIVCAALNYRAHAEELGKTVPDEPVLFFKPPTAVIGAWQSIVLPPQSARVDYEGELAVVIGKPCRRISPAQAPEFIFGYTCANDVTARDLQSRDGLFGRAKGFDTFCPIGPWIETEVPDPSALTLTTRVNGEIRQKGNTGDMIFDAWELLSFASGVMTLLPGDVLLTGTPPGIGPLRPGDEVQVEISDVALLTNTVVAERDQDPESSIIQ